VFYVQNNDAKDVEHVDSATRDFDVWYFRICSKAGDTETVGLAEISFGVTCLVTNTRTSGVQTSQPT